MLKIGLTGGIASGKSALATLFSSFGIPVINLDAISRDLVEPGEPALRDIVEHFGDHVLSSDGTLDRRQLRELIYGSPSEREWLEALLHPLIRARQNELINAASSPYVMIEIPLLVEKQLQHSVDKVLLVDTPRALQLERAMKRDNASMDDIERILDIQASREERLAIADDVVVNDGGLAELQDQAEQLHHTYIALAANM